MTTFTQAQAAPLKEIQKFIWSQGDFEQLAREVMPAAEALVEACGVESGERVLDVAAGTGDAAVAAARRGAVATASDITPRMIELGRARTGAEGVEVDWVEADAEALPFEDGSFDRVLSCFGAMFAPRPQAAAAELFRVARPGATIGLATWLPVGYVGRLIATVSSHMPAPPEGVPSPIDWGVDGVVRERLDGLAAGVLVERREVTTEHPSVEAMCEFQLSHAGPLVAARMALGDRFEALAAEVRSLIGELNEATDGSARVTSGYLLIVATKPA